MASKIIGLDIGEKRIGVASADAVARVAHPLTTLEVDDQILDSIVALLHEDVTMIVVGLPRNMQGEETAQSEVVRQFVRDLEQKTDLPIELQDESLTSVEAEKRLKLANPNFEKGDVDKEAAAIILQDKLDAS